jgi:DNA-binding response OmpR family regulator
VHLLLVEDDPTISRFLLRGLREENHVVDLAEDAESAEQFASGAEYDAILLDVMLPGGVDGFTLCRRLRDEGVDTPVLMLTARGHSEDVLKGFTAGADDYLTKPFELEILIARLRGLLRRGQWTRAQSPAQPPEPDSFVFGGKSVHFDLLELHVRGEIFKLTLMEMNVLRHLIRNAGRPVARGAMLEAVWGLREDTDTRALDNFIVRLRRYIEDDPGKPRHLISVRGVGYRFDATPQ